jgi:hypothetical protein
MLRYLLAAVIMESRFMLRVVFKTMLNQQQQAGSLLIFPKYIEPVSNIFWSELFF